jgi:serine/threonine protein kinase
LRLQVFQNQAHHTALLAPQVRRGYDTKTCDFVAVKLVVTTGESNFTGGERGVDLLRRVLTEVRVMQALGSHPHICGYIGTYALRTRLAIVMEYVRGGDLFMFLTRWGPLSEPDAAHCMRHLLTGLQYMHSKGIAHRDVKLENILVSGDPSMGDIKTCILKLVDFNLSSAPPQRRGHSSDTEAIINSLTGGSSPVGGGGATQASFAHSVSTSINAADAEDTPETARPGTPTSTLTCMTALDCSPAALVAMHSHVGSLYYAAPCVYAATPKKGYGLKCDIWSSGVCCYSCLMNCFPFTESTEKKLCERVRLSMPVASIFLTLPFHRL